MSGVAPGDVIAGKFRIESVLGEGGMGYVVAARHLQLDQRVALKFMRDEVCTPEFKRRFLREARNTVRLKSKHVSRVLDVGALEGGAPYMVMEYLEGTDLSDLLHKKGPFPVPVACDYIIQACEAIAEAHLHGIVHRDLKPANLFLTSGSSGEPVVKVLDFGVSKVLELGMEDSDTSPGGRPRTGVHHDSVVTKASDLLGSPSYMAPEQVVSARDADAGSDVWSLGVILFRLTSGKAPFNGASLGELIQAIMHGPIPSLRTFVPDLPVGLEDVVGRCLERDRGRRLDVTELARLLAPYAGPVATPSLERIAILGPALLTAAPGVMPSGQSLASLSNAWARSPSPTIDPSQTGRRDMSPLGAVAWGAFACLVVAAGAYAVINLADRVAAKPAAPVAAVPKSAPTLFAGAPTEAPPAPVPTPTGSILITAPPTPPPSSAPVANPPTAGPRHGHGRPRPPNPGAKTPPAPSPGGPDIPAQREP